MINADQIVTGQDASIHFSPTGAGVYAELTSFYGYNFSLSWQTRDHTRAPSNYPSSIKLSKKVQLTLYSLIDKESPYFTALLEDEFYISVHLYLRGSDEQTFIFFRRGKYKLLSARETLTADDRALNEYQLSSQEEIQYGVMLIGGSLNIGEIQTVFIVTDPMITVIEPIQIVIDELSNIVTPLIENRATQPIKIIPLIIPVILN